MLEAKSVVKAVVPSSLIENPSPGNLQSTRLALHADEKGSSCCVYIASDCDIYKVQVPLHATLVSKGKESLLIPAQTEVITSQKLNRCPHRAEIQSIAISEAIGPGNLILGSVDSHGHLIVSKLHINGKDSDELTYSVLPQDSGVGEASWAGLCFCPSQWSMVAVARSFCKSIDIYDQDIHLRTFRTLWYPTALNYANSLTSGEGNPMLAVTEGCQLTLWDLRMRENGGCLQRICGSLGDAFYAVCSSSAGNIAVGGADRTVTIYDPRRWSALARWVHCSKYEITGLAFSSIDPSYIYVQGVDYEAFCGQWEQSDKIFSFRGDSNWLGFNKDLLTMISGSIRGLVVYLPCCECSSKDTIGGWCDSGSIFVADIAHRKDSTA